MFKANCAESWDKDIRYEDINSSPQEIHGLVAKIDILAKKLQECDESVIALNLGCFFLCFIFVAPFLLSLGTDI